MAKYHDGAVSGSRRIMDVLLTVLLARCASCGSIRCCMILH